MALLSIEKGWALELWATHDVVGTLQGRGAAKVERRPAIGKTAAQGERMRFGAKAGYWHVLACTKVVTANPYVWASKEGA